MFRSLLVLLFFCFSAHGKDLRWIIGESNTLPLALVEKGQIKEGILKDVAESLAKDLKRKLVFVVLPRGRVVQYLQEDRADGLCYIRPEWFKDDKEKLQWTDVLFTNREIVIQRLGSKEIESFKELKGKEIGTVLNYTYGKLESLIGEPIKRSDAPNMSSNFLKLESERTQYAVTDEFSYRYFLLQRIERKKTLSQSAVIVDDLEIRCALSKKSSVSLAQVNRSLLKMNKSGHIDEVLRKYLGPALKLKRLKN